jgi:hypothetical protein
MAEIKLDNLDKFYHNKFQRLRRFVKSRAALLMHQFRLRAAPVGRIKNFFGH